MPMAKDPVCGASVDEKTAAFKTILEKRVYYFHSTSCQAEFERTPDRYLSQMAETRHATHYGGYCEVSGCGKPARGVAWYMYFALLFFLLLLMLLFR